MAQYGVWISGPEQNFRSGSQSEAHMHIWQKLDQAVQQTIR
jgi:hypothetical protein